VATVAALQLTDRGIVVQFGQLSWSDAMITRRSLSLALAATIAMGAPAFAHKPKKPFVIDPVYVPQQVDFPSAYSPGTIVVDTANRFLYLIESDMTARRYGIGVGRIGLNFAGTLDIARKAEWPFWKPTKNMIRRNPKRYARYANGMKGGRRNPLGARALYLYKGDQDTFLRIHGTTEPWTIGQAVSNGCFRMVNEHVEDLYERVPVGTKVIVLRR
jgi:lipoprotein-anchoring transpeptidase ErfK/SrfK